MEYTWLGYSELCTSLLHVRLRHHLKLKPYQLGDFEVLVIKIIVFVRLLLPTMFLFSVFSFSSSVLAVLWFMLHMSLFPSKSLWGKRTCRVGMGPNHLFLQSREAPFGIDGLLCAAPPHPSVAFRRPLLFVAVPVCVSLPVLARKQE